MERKYTAMSMPLNTGSDSALGEGGAEPIGI
jgi:hypothetical protein